MQAPTREFYPAHHDPSEEATTTTTAMTASSSTSRHHQNNDTHSYDEFQYRYPPALLAELRTQIEFYFSNANLPHDDHLQLLLNSCHHPGAVPLVRIAHFPRVRKIFARHTLGDLHRPADPAAVLQCLHHSNVVQISDDGHWLRPFRGLPPTPPATMTTMPYGQEPLGGRGPADNNVRPNDFIRIHTRGASTEEGNMGPAMSASADTKAISTLSSHSTATASPSVTPTSFDSTGNNSNYYYHNDDANGGVPTTVSMTKTTTTTTTATTSATPRNESPVSQQHLGPPVYAQPWGTQHSFGPMPPTAVCAHPSYMHPPQFGPGPQTAQPLHSPHPTGPASQNQSPRPPHPLSPLPLEQGYVVPYPVPSNHPQGFVAAAAPPALMADAPPMMMTAPAVLTPQASTERELSPGTQHPEQYPQQCVLPPPAAAAVGSNGPPPFVHPDHGAAAVPAAGGYQHYYGYPQPFYPSWEGPAFRPVVPPPPQQGAVSTGSEVDLSCNNDDSSFDPSESGPVPASCHSDGSGSWKQPRRPHRRTDRHDNKARDASAAATALLAESKTVVDPPRNDTNTILDSSNSASDSVTSHSTTTTTAVGKSSGALPPTAPSVVGHATKTNGGGPPSWGKRGYRGFHRTHKSKINVGAASMSSEDKNRTHNRQSNVGAASILSEENFPALASPKRKGGTTAEESPTVAAGGDGVTEGRAATPPRAVPSVPYAEAAKAKKKNPYFKHKKPDSSAPRNLTADDVTRDMLGLSVDD